MPGDVPRDSRAYREEFLEAEEWLTVEANVAAAQRALGALSRRASEAGEGLGALAVDDLLEWVAGGLGTAVSPDL